MKKIVIALLILLSFSISICTAVFYNYKIFINRKKSNQLLAQTHQLIQIANNKKVEEISNDTNEIEAEIIQNENITKEDILLEDEIIGILRIPKLNIEAPIKEGTSQEVMKTSIGHFTESDYWNGNVSLASHNGGTNAHFFEHINKLKENDEIQYITKLGSKKYKVEKIYKIASYDWSSVTANTNLENKNTITLITCINGMPNYRLCVKGVEI